MIAAGNEISQVCGLEMLQDLRELVLDRNKIKAIGETSFASQWNLQELHLEENRLKELSYMGCLENLQRLFLGMNRLQVRVMAAFVRAAGVCHGGVCQCCRCVSWRRVCQCCRCVSSGSASVLQTLIHSRN